MLVIGLVGGVASGKSFVAQELQRLGAVHLDADRTGHEVLRDPQIEAAARQRWGAGILDAEEHIDRCRLARIVFAPPDGPVERKYLEQLTHPELGGDWNTKPGSRPPVRAAAAVLDAPLLLEAGWDKFVIHWCLSTCPQRAANTLRGPGGRKPSFPPGRAQEPLDLKRKRADVVIDNSSSPEQTRNNIERFWQSLFSGPARAR